MIVGNARLFLKAMILRYFDRISRVKKGATLVWVKQALREVLNVC